MRIDARVPVRFGPAGSLQSNEALVTFGVAGHDPGCACCLPRSAAGMALGALFLARATGAMPWFTGVVADDTNRAAIEAALRTDPVAAARFRGPPSGPDR